MPGEGELKARIVLEGEKEYSSSIKEAQRNLRTLRSELKAESAELGRNASEQQKNEVRARSLQKQIAEQEKIVKACRSALDEARQKYGDNADAVAKYEQKLNTARATLANMRNGLEEVSEGFDDAGDAAGQAMVETRSFSEALGSIGQAAGAISDSIEALFTGLINTVSGAIETIWGEMVDLAAKSNGYVDLAGFWGTDPITIQKWANAVGHASANLNDLEDIVTKINGKEAAKKVAELTGVSSENYQDQFAYAMAVMDAMSRMETKQRNAAAFELFGGRQATKAMDLLNDWGTVLEYLNKYDVENGGIGMSEEQLQQMSALYDQVNGINSTWTAFKDSFLAGLAPLALDLTSNAQGFLDSFISFMDADSQEARDAAMEEMEKNLTEFFTKLGEAIAAAAQALDQAGTEMQGSENGIIRAIGTVLTSLADVLEWFSTDGNIDKVVHAFEALAAAWTAAKFVQGIANLASLAANLTLIKSGGGILAALFGLGAKGAAGAAAGAAGSAAAGAAGGAAGLTLGAMFKGLASTIIKAVPWAAGAYILGENALTAQGNDDIVDKDGNLRPEMQKDFVVKANGDVMVTNKEHSLYAEDSSGLIWPKEPEPEPEKPGLQLTPEQMAAAQAFWDDWRKNPGDFSDESWDAFESAFSGFESTFDELNKRMDEYAFDTHPDTWQEMEDIPQEIFGGMEGFNSGAASLDNASATLQGLPAGILAAVRAGVSNIVVTLDGSAVGGLVSPYVSTIIGRQMIAPV